MPSVLLPLGTLCQLLVKFPNIILFDGLRLKRALFSAITVDLTVRLHGEKISNFSRVQGYIHIVGRGANIPDDVQDTYSHTSNHNGFYYYV